MNAFVVAAGSLVSKKREGASGVSGCGAMAFKRRRVSSKHFWNSWKSGADTQFLSRSTCEVDRDMLLIIPQHFALGMRWPRFYCQFGLILPGTGSSDGRRYLEELA